jgi:predicted  nucleic acid-binding Zn-ribbon protein
MTSAADLYSLQELDLQRDGRRAVIADIEARLGEPDEIVEARETVEDSIAALDRLRKRQREMEGQIADLDAKVQPLETRLYDGSVRNPKELTDLQRELESFKQKRNQLDEQGIALMDSVEAGNRSLEEARADLAGLETRWEEERRQLLESKTRAETEQEALDGRRGAQTKGMDQGVLGLYEQLRRTKQGRAVSRVERGICQGCRTTLPTHLTQRIRTGRELVQCPRCERILVVG